MNLSIENNVKVSIFGVVSISKKNTLNKMRDFSKHPQEWNSEFRWN